MSQIFKLALLAVVTVSGLSACAVVPAQVVYTGPRLAVVAPPAVYVGPGYYGSGPGWGHHYRRGW